MAPINLGTVAGGKPVGAVWIGTGAGARQVQAVWEGTAAGNKPVYTLAAPPPPPPPPPPPSPTIGISPANPSYAVAQASGSYAYAMTVSASGAGGPPYHYQVSVDTVYLNNIRQNGSGPFSGGADTSTSAGSINLSIGFDSSGAQGTYQANVRVAVSDRFGAQSIATDYIVVTETA